MKERVQRKLAVKYIDFIKQIVKSQSYIRRFLAVKRYRTLREEEYEWAVITLQIFIRYYLDKQRRKQIIKKRRDAVQVLEKFACLIIAKIRRKERLKQIRANLCRLRMEAQLRYWINQHRYLETEEPPYNINNINNPTTLIQRFIDNRAARGQIREHNSAVLSRRLDALNTDMTFRISQNNSASSITSPRTSPGAPTPVRSFA